MSAAQALKYGLIDEVIETRKVFGSSSEGSSSSAKKK
jgi:hypothetical protein